MRVRLDGTPDELREKGPQLIKALAARLGVDLVSLLDAEDALEKAARPAEVTSHYRPIRDLVKVTTQVYGEEMATMLKEIDEVLDQAEG